MREAADVERFVLTREGKITPSRMEYERAMYAGCVPSKYWFVKRTDVRHNVSAFRSRVLPYRKRIDRAFQEGYGLIFLGDNGTGKTLFVCYLLGRAVQLGYSVYYTTLKGLDTDIKLGYSDHAWRRRLAMMLESDFLAIDELGKGHASEHNIVSELEHIVKGRYDNGDPTLLASNLTLSDLSTLYGPTMQSMMGGRFSQVALETGDFREKVALRMSKRMGYR